MPLKWQHSCGVWRYVEEAVAFFPYKHNWLNVSTPYGSHTFTMYSLWICLCSPEKYEHAFPSRKLSLEFPSFWVKWGDDIRVTGFSISSHNDTSNSLSPVIMLYRKSLPLPLKQESKQASNCWHVSSPALFISDISWCGIQWTQNFCNKTHNKFWWHYLNQCLNCPQYGSPRNPLICFNKFPSTSCLFEFWDAVKKLPGSGWSCRFKFPPLSFDFIT